MREHLQLGILDFGSRVGSRPTEAQLRDTIDAAVVVERLGYDFYWLAEHQSPVSLWGTPAVMIAAVAAATRRLRVGAAGVLLHAHNPLQVAQDFALLSQLYPARIDLGIASGKPPVNGDELRWGLSAKPLREDLYERLVTVLSLLGFAVASMPTFAHATCIPAPGRNSGLQVWLLGAGGASHGIAAQLGAACALSLFHRATDPSVLRDYYRAFRPSSISDQPCGCIALAGACHERIDTSTLAPENPFIRPTLIGNAAACIDMLSNIRATTGCNRFCFLDVSATRALRLASYQNLARACGLVERAS